MDRNAGKEGYLSICAGHAPLITGWVSEFLPIERDPDARYLSVVQGYAEVLPDRVIVLAELSERAEEIDVPRTQAALDRAKAEIAGAGSKDDEYQRASFALQRALVRLQAASKGGASGAQVHHSGS